MMFWMFFEQALADAVPGEHRPRHRLGFRGVEQFFNPLFILVFGALFTMLWANLGRKGRDPSIPTKFGLALVRRPRLLRAGVAASSVEDTGLVSILILITCCTPPAAPVSRSACRPSRSLRRMTGMSWGVVLEHRGGPQSR